jgi:hypothetical protein
MEVNCHQLVVEIEERPDRPWPLSKQEAYRDTGEIVSDTTRVVARLISSKCEDRPLDKDVYVLASQLPWYGWVNPERQIDRGFPMNARLLLNEAVGVLLKLLFAANSRFWPHPKWQFAMSLDLAWLPSGYEQALKAIVSSGAEPPALLSAIVHMRDIGRQTLAYMTDHGLIPADPFDYVSIHLDVDRQLLLHPRLPTGGVVRPFDREDRSGEERRG